MSLINTPIIQIIKQIITPTIGDVPSGVFFQPTDIEGLVLWLDAVDTSTITPTPPGGLVTQWDDKSGNINNATATGTERPTYIPIADGVNPSLSFDGIANFLTVADAASLDWNTTVSVFMVHRIVDGGANQDLFRKSSTAGEIQWVTADDRYNFRGGGSTSVNSNTSQTVNIDRLITVTKGVLDSTIRMRLDGVDELNTFVNGALADNSAPITVGSGPSSLFLDGNISAFLIYDRVLTIGEIDQVENYLFKRYPLFFPTDLSGLVLWLDATDVGSVTESGGLVTQWDDKSGNNNDAVATGTERPTYITETPSVIPSVSFDGGDNLLTITDAASLDWGNTVSIFVVFRPFSASGTENVLNKISGGQLRRNSRTLSLLNATNLLITSNDPAFNNDTNSILTVTQGAGGGDQRMRINGADELVFSTASSLSDNTDDLIIGNLVAGNAGFNGGISELIIYDRVLTNSEVDQVETALAVKYGITI